MPIFVFLRSSLFFGARQRPVRQTFDFRPFPAARRAEKPRHGAAQPSALYCSVTTSDGASARAHCMSQLKSACFASVLLPLALALNKSLVYLSPVPLGRDYRVTFCVARVTVPAALSSPKLALW